MSPSRYRLAFPVLFTALALTGCSASGLLAPVEAPRPVAVALPPVSEPDVAPDFEVVTGPSTAPITAGMAVLGRLREVEDVWEGTPYRFGGANLQGVDCSGFVQRAYAEAFGMALSRSTSTQVLEGREIRRQDLQPGDLVFFQTGRNQRHVGIYLRDGQFLHASTRIGVTVDDLSQGYYDRTYWTARRMLSPDRIAALVADSAPAVASVEVPRRDAAPARPVRRTPSGPAPGARIVERPIPAGGAPAARRAGW
jgi:hypothetical protein